MVAVFGRVSRYVELYLRQVSGATRTLAKVPEFSILRIAD